MVIEIENTYGFIGIGYISPAKRRPVILKTVAPLILSNITPTSQVETPYTKKIAPTVDHQ